MSLPLAGVKVVDLTAVISGPLATYQLALLGADVIKVEVQGVGDIARKLGPDQAMNQKMMGVSFWALNAGKKSLSLNLKTEKGREVLRRLVKDADVIAENFRPGVMKKLGADYDTLSKINPKLVYCSISGFGQDGPMSHRPSYDQIIQGMSGIMAQTGDKDTAPNRVGFVACDTMVSMNAAFAIAAALYQQKQTGKGSFIDVSMLDSTLATMPAWLTSAYLNAGVKPMPLGNDNPASSPSGAFKTAEGLMNIVCNDDKQFVSLCDTIGVPELKDDERFVTRPLRVKNRVELKVLLEAALQKKSAAEWDDILIAAQVPVGPILSLPEALGLPQIRHRDFIKTFRNVPGVDRDISVTKLGFRLSGEQPDTDLPPPMLGEHNDEVLSQHGYSAEEIAELKREQII